MTLTMDERPTSTSTTAIRDDTSSQYLQYPHYRSVSSDEEERSSQSFQSTNEDSNDDEVSPSLQRRSNKHVVVDKVTRSTRIFALCAALK
jgi:hypothetical protein